MRKVLLQAAISCSLALLVLGSGARSAYAGEQEPAAVIDAAGLQDAAADGILAEDEIIAAAETAGMATAKAAEEAAGVENEAAVPVKAETEAETGGEINEDAQAESDAAKTEEQAAGAAGQLAETAESPVTEAADLKAEAAEDAAAPAEESESAAAPAEDAAGTEAAEAAQDADTDDTEETPAEEETPAAEEEEKKPYISAAGGVDYAPVYDYYWYISRYPDLQAAFGDDQQKALQHFINSGMREGRMASESFDVDSYRNANQDLRIAFRSDLKRYYLHYLRNGIREGRSATGVDTLQNPVTVYQAVNYSPVYDYYFYTGYYKDISEAFGTDDVRILEHFVNNGMREHRRGCESFDVISYRLQYQDLRVAYGTDYPAYYRHYMRNGAKEGREGTGTTELQNPVTVLDGTDYAPVYNFRFYTEKYPDMMEHFGTDDVAALKHFISHGMREERQGSEEFEVESYRLSYQDLRVAFRNNYPAYYMHYLRNGKKEGRTDVTGVTELQNILTTFKGTDYSRVYDFAYYIGTYKDLGRLFSKDDVGALEHFVNHGMKEQRQACENFDERSYRYKYQDLRKAFRSNYAQYYLHFIRSGYKENRVTTGVTKLENPILTYGNVDLSPIYDYYYFVEKNPDVIKSIGDNDTETIEYFVRYFMPNNKAGKASYSNEVYQNLKRKMDPMLQKALNYGSATPYLILVNKSSHVVAVYTGGAGNWRQAQAWTCSVGAYSTPTPEGVFSVGFRTLYFGDQYYRAWYATQFIGDYFFHTILYRPGSSPSVVYDGTLGAHVSHGCVRLPLGAAQWIYNNIPMGTKVVVY